MLAGQGGRRNRPAPRHVRWPGDLTSGDKWIFYLTAASVVAANQVTQWKGQLLDGAAGIFGHGKSEAPSASVDLKGLHAKLGELTQT